MALDVTGYVATTGDGVHMRIHEDMPSAYNPTEVHELGHDKGRLHVVDVPQYDHDLPGRIGQAMLSAGLVTGRYEALYDIDEVHLDRLGRSGIMTSALRVLISRVIEQYTQASVLEFNIDAENQRSIGLATKLGAVMTAKSNTYELSIPAYYERLRQERLVRSV